MIFLWSLVSFLIGSLPFSLWLVKFRNKNIRDYGDGNPGAFNAWKAGGYRIGIPALLLDYSKGVLPVGLGKAIFGFTGWDLVPVALAPILGHAFSPFLRFRGGKAVAATFGIWTGLTRWEGPTILGILIGIAFRLQSVDGWSVIFAMLGLLAYLLLRQAETYILAIWLGNILILSWKHRHDLQQRIELKPPIKKVLGKKN